MSLENINGFKIFEKDTIVIESDKVSECMEFFQNNDYLEKIWISKFHGYLKKDISFLKEYRHIKKVVINGPFETSGLCYLNELEFLSYENYIKDQILDLSNFQNLNTCYLDLSSKIRQLNTLSKVKDIRLFHYTVKEKDLTGINNLKQLESLYISMSNVESLTGIEEFKKLKKIEFHYFRNLTHIKALASLGNILQFLTIGNAKKILDFNSAKQLKKLEVLGFSNCGSISSIKFINDMPKLESFRFVGTNVIDGDLSPLIRLRFAGFINKRHYSMTYEELAKLHGHSIGL
nr:hypothetical protein [uncultured Mucilaginibacter sp.]